MAEDHQHPQKWHKQINRQKLQPIDIIGLGANSFEICDTLPGLDGFSQEAETLTHIYICIRISQIQWIFRLHDLHDYSEVKWWITNGWICLVVDLARESLLPTGLPRPVSEQLATV